MKNPHDLKQYYGKWEVIKDLIDQCIDIMLNLRLLIMNANKF